MRNRLLRRFLVFALSLSFVAMVSETLLSGNYHSGSGLVCSDCHTMHNWVDGAEVVIGGPYDKMLMVPSTNDLCMTCHDGGSGTDGAPDVITTAGVGQATNRGAGAFRATAGTASTLAHDLGVLAATPAPGGTWFPSASTGLTCGHCHDAHGNAYYRNLLPNRGGAAAVNVDDVSETVLTPTSTQYDVTNITYTGDKMSQWCAGCHTSFYISPYAATFTNDTNVGGQDTGDTVAGTTNQWHRHPASHVTFTEANTNGHVDSASWTGATSRTPFIDVTANGATGDDMVFCGSCHKAHGSDKDRSTAGGNPANLIYDDPTTGTIQDGTSLLQLCQMCHNQ